MKRRTSLLLRFAGIAVVLLIVASFALSRLFASDPLAEAVPVEVEEAVTTSMQTRVVGSCTFRARRSVEVTSDVGGRAIAIPVQVGDPVTDGQTLVLFEQTELRNALVQAQASLRETELGLAHRLAKLRATIVSSERTRNDRVRSLERNRSLHRSGTVSDDQLAQAEQAERDAFDALQSARAELSLAASLPVDAEPPMDAGGDARIIANDPNVIQARLAAERAAEDLRQATVVAPLDGTVTKLEATLGNHLGAGHPVATVETLDDILAGVQIDEVDIGKIQLGQQVILTTETLRDVELLGTITLVPPSMETTGSVPLVTIDVAVDEDSLPEGARLLAGSSCRARIDAELKQDATAVPYAALLERAGATIAFVAIPVEEEDGQYVLERREVSIGVSTPSQVEVKEGIEPGELVVVGNLALLRDGLSVMVEQELPAEEERADETDGAQDGGQPEGAAADETTEDQPVEEASTEQS
jgi:RND family efflux transporter MFP subunit